MSNYKIASYNDLQVIYHSEDVWITQKQISDLFNVNVPAVSKHISAILSENELDNSTISQMEIVTEDGKTRRVNHYNLDMVIAVGFRVKSKEGTAFRKWAIGIIRDYSTQGVSVNPQLAEKNPERVQDNFYKQFSPSMKKHLNRHGHTEEYRKERLDNIQARKGLSGELIRTVDGKPNFGAIMGMFHVSLTGKTKRQLLAEYEHTVKSTTALDTLGSMVINQMNMLMQSVNMVLANYPDDYIPNEVHVTQIQRLIDKYSGNIRAHLDMLSNDLGVPVERLGENTHKRLLL